LSARGRFLEAAAGLTSRAARRAPVEAARAGSLFWAWLGRTAARARAVGREIATGTTLAPERWTDYLDYTGTAAAVLLVLQAATGVLLALHYEPHPSLAFASFSAVGTEVPYGLLVSGLHAAGARLLILVGMVHLLRVAWTSSYRGPRAGHWYTGVALLSVMMLSGFSGYLLPWGQQSFWACVVGTEAAGALPVVGKALVHALRGGPEVGGPTLTRFYLFHVFLFPLAVAGLLYWHIQRVWRTGVSGPPDATARPDPKACRGCGACERTCAFSAVFVKTGQEGRRAEVDEAACNACRACVFACPAGAVALVRDNAPVPTEPIFPHNVLRRSAAVLAALLVLFAGVYFFRGLAVGHKVPADPLSTPDRIKPDWYFLAPYQVLKILPSERWGLFALLAAFGLVAALPALDKKGPRRPEDRPVFIRVFQASVAVFVVLTVWGWLS